MSTDTNHVVNSFVLLILIVSLAIETSVASPASATTILAICTPGNLVAPPPKVATGASTLGSVAFYLPIRIINTGATCSISGILRIRSVSDGTRSRVVFTALPTSAVFRDLTLKNRKSVYTSLGYWWTTSFNSFHRKQWLKLWPQ